ncbi:MAG: alpha/beta hydrolase [Coleofasciculus sp. C2-GNP5-27]
MNEITLLVPGIGFGGIEMIFLSHQLQKMGLNTQIFFHTPGRKTIEEKAKMLNDSISSFEVDKIHYVGHSMGGLIIVKMFISYPNQLLPIAYCLLPIAYYLLPIPSPRSAISCPVKLMTIIKNTDLQLGNRHC